eukprot:CAMPEP_0115001110 /NCGR_PEP_ID=MMETSP0216-20121206/17168_1 /TAXON_ID=223996 /ORGANISM="Protocruzia adherens, Strain Boccale" /LENGTH=470 /DNA_ID=CAMNT_0002366357 /DNA_START=12 /DNA_END=1424 /DNA_ORIENTATION=+
MVLFKFKKNLCEGENGEEEKRNPIRGRRPRPFLESMLMREIYDPNRANLHQNFQKMLSDNLGLDSVLKEPSSTSRIVERIAINFKKECNIEIRSETSDTSRCSTSGVSSQSFSEPHIPADNTKMYFEELRQNLKACILSKKPDVSLSKIAGNENLKNMIRDSLKLPRQFPHLFQGEKPTPWNKVLLYGPPGVGKTSIIQAVCNEIDATCFWVSVADVTSKFIGESEKLLRLLFELAKEYAPSIILIDEMDSIGRKRNGQESETERRIKTEFLRQMDALQGSQEVYVFATTNMPWELDIAALKRFNRRLLVSLPDSQTRAEIFQMHAGDNHELTPRDLERLAKLTEGYSGSDICTAINEALMKPIKKLTNATFFKRILVKEEDERYVWICSTEKDPAAEAKKLDQIPKESLQIPKATFEDFKAAIQNCRPTVHPSFIELYRKFMEKYGHEDQKEYYQKSDHLPKPNLTYFT